MDQTPAEFVVKIKHLSEVEATSSEFSNRVSELTALYQMMQQYEIQISELNRATFLNLASEYEALQTAIQHTKETKNENTEKYKLELEEGKICVFWRSLMKCFVDLEFQKLVEKSVEIGLAARDDDLLSKDSDYEDVVPTLQELNTKIEQLKSQSLEIQSYQEFLNLPITSSEEIEESVQDILLRLDLWVGGRDFQNQLQNWEQLPFLEVNLEQMESVLSSQDHSITQMEQGLPQNPHLTQLRQQIEKLKKLFPLLKALQNQCLRDRHWEKIHEALGEPIASSTIIHSLLEKGILRWDDYITSISIEASQEAALEHSLTKITTKWTQTDLSLIHYKDSKDSFILSSIEEITTLLEDSLLSLGTISSSRFVSGIQTEVDRVNDELRLFSETLEEWLLCQKNWIYLESIFSAPDIQRQLPAESKTFFEVDKAFKEIMKKTKDRPNALLAGTTPGWLESFQESNKILEKIQKNLEDYLETKRITFPRFYFLSNDELLEILAETKNVQAVQPHLGRCFDGIKKLEFGTEPKSINIEAMVSGKMPI